MFNKFLRVVLSGGVIAGMMALGNVARAQGDLVEFLGGEGCTLGADSRAKAQAAGFKDAQIDKAIAEALAGGLAEQQGEYVVLSKEICMIRLPKIQSDYTVDSPEIKKLTSARDAYKDTGDIGCFLGDVGAFFRQRYPEVAGNSRFLRFYAAGLISGELTFYSPSPLSTPMGFQDLTGECADVPYADDIKRAKSFIRDAYFDGYIRKRMKDTVCTDSGGAVTAMEYTHEMQGVDVKSGKAPEQPINAWLWFEFDLIAMAAGWREGMSWSSKGELRPPLCHYAKNG